MVYKAKYLGGYSAFPGPIDVSLDLKPKYLEVPELNLRIPYKELTDVRNISLVEAVRFIFIGGYGMAWRREKPLLLLSFKDDVGIQQNTVFDVEKLMEVQPVIYQKMLEAKGVKTRKPRRKTCGTCAFFRKPVLCPMHEVNPNATHCIWYRRLVDSRKTTT